MLGIGLLLGVTLLGSGINWYQEGIKPVLYEAEAREPVVVLIGTTTKEYTEFQRIADCESGTRLPDGSAVPWSAKQRNEDGSVVIGQYTTVGEDIGKWQINTFYHLEKARSWGIDLYSEKGNERYAKILYHEAGGAPWRASQDCWDRVY